MIAPRSFAVTLPLVLLLAVAPSLADEPTTQIYETRHRTAEELAPLARTVLGEEGVAAIDGGSLVLVGTPSAVRRAAEVLLARDVAQKLVTLHLEVRSEEALRSAGYRIRWRAEEELRSGVLVSKTGNPRRLSTSREEHTGFSIRVRDGATGRIDIGRSVVVLSRWFFGGENTVIAASSELRATPRVLGSGEISVELEWSRRHVDDAGDTAGDGGRTTIIVRPTEVVALGALSRRLDSPVSRTYRTRSRRAHSDEQVVLLRVDVD